MKLKSYIISSTLKYTKCNEYTEYTYSFIEVLPWPDALPADLGTCTTSPNHRAQCGNSTAAAAAQQHSPGRGANQAAPLELAADFCQSSPLVSGRPSKSRGGLDLKRVAVRILDPTKNSKCSLCKSVNRFNLWVLKFERWNAMTNDDESTASATSTASDGSDRSPLAPDPTVSWKIKCWSWRVSEFWIYGLTQAPPVRATVVTSGGGIS